MNDKSYKMQRLLTSADDLDAITENGIYWYYTESLPANVPFKNSAIVEVFGDKTDNTKKIQRVTRYGSSGSSAFRPMLSSTGWRDWTRYIVDSEFNPPNKQLWTGTFDQGSITIPDFDKYTLFRITLSNMATDIVATHHTNYFRGIGGTCWAEDEASAFFFGANVSSGNVITLVSCVERNFKNGTYKKCTVTGIYGLC